MDIIVPTEGRQTVQRDSSELIGVDGNAFAVIGATVKILQRAGASQEFLTAFRREAMGGSYDHVIATAIAYLDAEPVP